MRNSLRMVPFALLPFALACSPVVRVEAPREPITINVNVKLDADVRVKLEDQAHKDVAKNPGIF
jgi:YnbE-like lipoprotein